MALATLSIDLVAKLATFEKDLNRAAGAAEASAGKMTQAFGLARAGLVGLVSGLSVGQFVSFFRATVDGVDKLNDLSDATGATVEKLSALEDIGARTGAGIDTVGEAVGKLNKVLNEATPDSQQAATLKALGLSAAELRRLDPADALKKLADALSTFSDDARKARAVQDLLGKSYKELAPFLKDLAEAGKLNATVTADQAREAEKFNQELFKLQKSSVDTARALTGPMVEALNKTIELFRQGSKEGRGFFETLRNEQTKILSNYLGLNEKSDGDRLKSLRDDVASIDAALERGNVTEERRAELQKKRIGRMETIARLEKQATESFRPSQNYGDTSVKPGVGDIPDVARIKAEADKRLAESERIAKLQADAEEQFQKDRSDAFDFYGKQQVEQNKAATDAIAAQWKQIFEEIDAEQDRAIEEGKAYLTDRVEEVSEFAKEAARNIQDAIGETLYDTLTGKFKDIGKLWGELLLRMAAQAAAAKLGNYLFGADYGKTGVIGGVIGGFFGGANGSHAGGLDSVPFDGYRAILHKGERVQTAAEAKGGGRMIDASINGMSVGAGVSRSEMYAAISQAQAKQEQRIRRLQYQGAM